MSESATEKYLIDPDKWFLPKMPKSDVIWAEEDTLKELYGEMVCNFAKEVDRKLTTSTEVEMLIRAKGAPMK